MKANRLVVVDDEPQICELVRDVAEPMGFEVAAFTSVDQFMGAYHEIKPTAALVDLNIGDADGIQVLQFLAEQQTDARIVMISGADGKLLDASRRIGAEHKLSMTGTLSKPIMIADMESMLFKCMLRSNERPLTASDLSRAIDYGELSVHYQPMVSLTKNTGPTVLCAEALVRWRHPERGTLMPDRFIELAEEDDLMVRLTDAVLLQTAEQLQVWKLAGIDMRINVNLTCSVIDDPDFPERLSGLMKQFDIDPSRLVLELSERGSLLDILQRLDIITRLRLKGFGLALDDFGVGQSSLVHLHKLPFSALKIDRCFISEMAASRKASLLVKSIIDLAHNLDMEVCAEGVDNAGDLSTLASFGCEFAQGYLFSEAMPASAVAKNLRTWQAKRLLE